MPYHVSLPNEIKSQIFDSMDCFQLHPLRNVPIADVSYNRKDCWNILFSPIVEIPLYNYLSIENLQEYIPWELRRYANKTTDMYFKLLQKTGSGSSDNWEQSDPISTILCIEANTSDVDEIVAKFKNWITFCTRDWEAEDLELSQSLWDHMIEEIIESDEDEDELRVAYPLESNIVEDYIREYQEFKQVWGTVPTTQA
ncbi:MAG: hypothetical protein EOP45_08045 [Sphingobacteriaceae bacterium]|nr:MAG: hypothetical protein EOP45_08045 [Sphingobacteriaceae bacterium]